MLSLGFWVLGFCSFFCLPLIKPPFTLFQVRDILAMHADEVFSLENRKFQLKMSMDERRQEIEVHR